ncbi:MAG: hypothetical protein E3J73_03745 [Candidatus Bathyarchaeum sp.]|nr:MAG: hypothetical protein E3J73_03745 [Candidatus Bathyarchaeum sp.]
MRMREHVGEEHVLYLAYFAVAIFCFFLLINSRKELCGSIWEALDPRFMLFYSVATLLLVSLVLSSRINVNVKLFSISVHAFLTLMMPFAYALAPLHDPWFHLAMSRWVYNTGHVYLYPYIWTYNPLGLPLPITALYTALRYVAQNVLTAVFARMISLDVFWVHISLIPALWGLFMPCLAYGISFKMTQRKGIAVLSAMLSYAYFGEILGGSWHAANNLAFLFAFFQLYCLANYLTENAKRYALLTLMAALAAAFSHPTMAVLTLSFLILAIAYKQYLKRKTFSRVSFALAFLICVFLLPLSFVGKGAFYPDKSYFSLSIIGDMVRENLPDAIWNVVFGEILSSQTNVQQTILSLSVFLLGLLGVAMLWRRKESHNPALVTYLFALILIVEVDSRISRFFMINVPVSPSRMLKVSYFLLLIFAAVSVLNVYDTVRKQLFVRRLFSRRFSIRFPLGELLLILSISGLVIANVIEAYSVSVYKGIQPTTFELDIVKFIHEDARGHSYIVIDKLRLSTIGGSYVGAENRKAHYFVASSTMRRQVDEIIAAIESNKPSQTVALLGSFMRTWPAEYTYFIATQSAMSNFWRHFGDPCGVFVSGTSYISDRYVFRISDLGGIEERASLLFNCDFESWYDWHTPSFWSIETLGNVVFHSESENVLHGNYSVYGKATSIGEHPGIIKLGQSVFGMPNRLSFSFYLINHTHREGRLHVWVEDSTNQSNYVALGLSFSDLGWKDIGLGASYRKYRKSVVVEPRIWSTIEWDILRDWEKVYSYRPSSVYIGFWWVAGSYMEDEFIEAIFDAVEIS